mmetsp:Transcript_22050/g.34207  ORF Transcript_22050/g.34207 Transcript_22050/m.34207 type:complete len:305 (+) Transcript_22050:2681-3595(+)|eukprot:CAMPEP_0170511038 /NCGR_PEP_ID=MMETSP0208-20121228/66085_1 /TAXON_ID=197538 /ORGANISM="Strombidium inclinatum, Strain S3" /LENGTH=304 /DNA_ID=CAMNT_0010794541 /DNA_START=2631 /DNA_END=3545 /DNA_ORIENTATION=+
MAALDLELRVDLLLDDLQRLHLRLQVDLEVGHLYHLVDAGPDPLLDGVDVDLVLVLPHFGGVGLLGQHTGVVLAEKLNLFLATLVLNILIDIVLFQLVDLLIFLQVLLLELEQLFSSLLPQLVMLLALFLPFPLDLDLLSLYLRDLSLKRLDFGELSPDLPLSILLESVLLLKFSELQFKLFLLGLILLFDLLPLLGAGPAFADLLIFLLFHLEHLRLQPDNLGTVLFTHELHQLVLHVLLVLLNRIQQLLLLSHLDMEVAQDALVLHIDLLLLFGVSLLDVVEELLVVFFLLDHWLRCITPIA